ncbi:hypothetical protein CPB86DRAFT_821027 [Serendipita vermifera]|nr:hypothetical protein CPB86DRAFT_821027 [Serendipita vermifera]
MALGKALDIILLAQWLRRCHTERQRKDDLPQSRLILRGFMPFSLGDQSGLYTASSHKPVRLPLLDPTVQQLNEKATHCLFGVWKLWKLN